MKRQQLLNLTVKAVKKYNMINDNDHIAVGLSGGKDSLTSLIMLNELKKYFYPNIKLCGIAIDLSGDTDYSELENFCKEQNIDLYIERTDIKKIIFEVRKESNPCSLCAKMRKSALFTKAESLGYHKVVLGHNKDDIIETFLMSLLEEGRIHTCPCNTYLDKTHITVIRPLMYVNEKDIVGFINKEELNKYVIKSTCPADGNTRREDMKNLMKSFRTTYDHFDDKIIGAIERAGIDGYKEDNDSLKLEKKNNKTKSKNKFSLKNIFSKK